MISYVKGELAEILESSIVVDCSGMGIEINVPLSVMRGLPLVGEEIKIYTHFRVSEDDMSLYGFNSRRDLEMFERLIGVSGIGPKGALAILSTLTPDDLRMAIVAGDSKAISTAPGIGAKTAQRVIIDLKDKIDVSEMLGSGSSGTTAVQSGVREEAAEALIALGYSASEAAKCIRRIEITEDMDVEQVIRLALRNM